jgi:hypothetical protein
MRTELTVSVLVYAEAIIRATLRDYPNTDRHIEWAQTFLELPPNPPRAVLTDIGWNWIREKAAA